ncbi:MAG: lipopolysaccharide assembly protein LapA domain-containing protein [Elusimicrobiota bacterium]
MSLFLIAALAVSVLACIFALQNPVGVAVTFLSWQITSSVGLVVVLALALGAALTIILLAPTLISNGIKISMQKKKINRLEKHIDQMVGAAPVLPPMHPSRMS